MFLHTRITLKQFINDSLTKKHRLNDNETDKLFLNAIDFVKLLRCYWIININIFSHKRQRIQLITILLIVVFIKSRFEALLEITYRDLNLFVQRDKIIEEITLILQLKFTRIKSRKKRKRS